MNPTFQVPIYEWREALSEESGPHAAELSEDEGEEGFGPEGGEGGAGASVVQGDELVDGGCGLGVGGVDAAA